MESVPKARLRRARSRAVWGALLLLGGEALAGTTGDAGNATDRGIRPEPIDTVNLEEPAFPDARTYRIGDAFRIRAQSRFLPEAKFDGFDADLYAPELRLRVALPLSPRAVLQFTGRFGASVYDFDGHLNPFGLGPQRDPFDPFYSSSLELQGGYRLNESRSLFVDGEMWSILASVSGRGRWEEGAFSDSLTGGGALALGYEIDDLIRIGLGVSVSSRIDRGGVSVSPVATLRWRPTDDLTVRNRGRGLQIEYDVSRSLEIFATGFLDGEKFLLKEPAGLPDDLTFRDEGVFAGLGFEWKISRHLRLNVEGGAAAYRKLRVKSRSMGTLFRETSDPSAYFDIRFEVRP